MQYNGSQTNRQTNQQKTDNYLQCLYLLAVGGLTLDGLVEGHQEELVLGVLSATS